MHSRKRSLFFYLVAISISTMSLFSISSNLMSLEWKEAVIFAKTYEAEQLDDTRVKVDESLEIVKKHIKKYTIIQPILTASAWFDFYIINQGHDLQYLIPTVERAFIVREALFIPVGSIAPPFVS